MKIFPRYTKASYVCKSDIVEVTPFFVDYVEIADQFVFRKLLPDFELITEVGVFIDADSNDSVGDEVHFSNFLILLVDHLIAKIVFVANAKLSRFQTGCDVYQERFVLANALL